MALWIKSKAMLMIHVRGSTVYKNEDAEHEKIGTPVCFALVEPKVRCTFRSRSWDVVARCWNKKRTRMLEG